MQPHAATTMNAAYPPEDERPFFEKEWERLSNDITRDFEELISSTNMLNRKLEDVVGMGKEIDPIAKLWDEFYHLMKEQKPDVDLGPDGKGMPGTGGHVVSGKDQ